MADRIRFHLDEHIDPDIAIALRRSGIDVTTTTDQKLLASDDVDQMARIRIEGRVIVTDDVDFLMMARSNTSHSGIAYCRRAKHSLGEIIQFLILIHGVYDPSEMTGRIEYL